MRASVIVLGLLPLALATGSVSAAIIHVPADQPTIETGIEAAVAGDTVLVSCGSYAEHDIIMKSGVCLRSETGGPDCVTIDAQGLGRGILCQNVDENASIIGFTIRNGLAPEEPFYPRGGGMALFTSSPAVIDCVIEDCVGENGGGGIVGYECNSLIERCVFARNSGIDGGGLYLNHSSPTIRECVIYENDCMFWGGAIFCTSLSSPRVVNSTLVRNSGHWGGGIWCVDDCFPVVENSIVAWSLEGEGVYVYDLPSHPSAVAVSCSDVYGNAGGNYGGVSPDQTGINGNISVDPFFCDSAPDDFSLSAGSPCLPENNECGVLMGAYGEGCVSTGLAAAKAAGDRARLTAAGANPFRATAEIAFRLPRAAQVTVRIFDPTGRLVRDLAENISYPAGTHAITWDGRDAGGRPVPSGIYLCAFDAGGDRDSRRIVVLR